MLAELAVKRWQLTLVAFIAVIALGANALNSIPKAEDPTFPFARFGITAVLPGASPGELERQVVDPIESKLNGLADVKALKTTISDSLALSQHVRMRDLSRRVRNGTSASPGAVPRRRSRPAAARVMVALSAVSSATT